MTTSVSLPTSGRTTSPRLAEPVGRFVAGGVAMLAAWMRPRKESPAEAASRLRILANQYTSQPGFAADLRAAADRHEQLNGID